MLDKRLAEATTPCKQDDSQSTSKSIPALRLGDWICINCNNLNFSFRTICKEVAYAGNRCKTQTRQTNFFSFMGQLVAANGGCYNLTETKRNPDMEMPSPEEKYWPTEQKPGKGNAVKEPKVFENALLLTPTKDQEKNQNQNPSEPYKSPFKLPSVSPLLKKFTESNVLDRYSTNESQQKKYDYTRSHAKLIDFGRCSTTQVVEDQDNSLDNEIDRLLENIEL